MTHGNFNEPIASLLLPALFYRPPQYLCLSKVTKAISALQYFLIKPLQKLQRSSINQDFVHMVLGSDYEQ